MINWNWKFEKMPRTYTIKFKEGETLMVSSTCLQGKCIFPYMTIWQNIIVLVIRRTCTSLFSRKMNDRNLIVIFDSTYNVNNDLFFHDCTSLGWSKLHWEYQIQEATYENKSCWWRRNVLSKCIKNIFDFICTNKHWDHVWNGEVIQFILIQIYFD